MHKDAPVYIPKDRLPEFGEKQDVAEVRGVKAVPVYEAAITLK